MNRCLPKIILCLSFLFLVFIFPKQALANGTVLTPEGTYNLSSGQNTVSVKAELGFEQDTSGQTYGEICANGNRTGNGTTYRPGAGYITWTGDVGPGYNWFDYRVSTSPINGCSDGSSWGIRSVTVNAYVAPPDCNTGLSCGACNIGPAADSCQVYQSGCHFTTYNNGAATCTRPATDQPNNWCGASYNVNNCTNGTCTTSGACTTNAPNQTTWGNSEYSSTWSGNNTWIGEHWNNVGSATLWAYKINNNYWNVSPTPRTYNADWNYLCREIYSFGATCGIVNPGDSSTTRTVIDFKGAVPGSSLTFPGIYEGTSYNVTWPGNANYNNYPCGIVQNDIKVTPTELSVCNGVTCVPGYITGAVYAGNTVACANVTLTVNPLNIACVSGTSCAGGTAGSTTGRLSTENGGSWNNPVNLTVTGTGPITNYYAAMYTGTTLTNANTFLSDAQGRVPSPGANGFLVRYDSTSYYVWASGAWRNLPWDIYNGAENIGQIVSNGTRSWQVKFLSGYGSKTMRTSAYVENSSGLKALSP